MSCACRKDDCVMCQPQIGVECEEYRCRRAATESVKPLGRDRKIFRVCIQHHMRVALGNSITISSSRGVMAYGEKEMEAL